MGQGEVGGTREGDGGQRGKQREVSGKQSGGRTRGLQSLKRGYELLQKPRPCPRCNSGSFPCPEKPFVVFYAR